MFKKVFLCLLCFLIPFASASLSCIDNEPAGLSTVRGALEVKQPGTLGREFYADTCLSPTLLKEYTCAGTEPLATEVTCQGICSEGACIQGERVRTQLQNTIALSYCGEYGLETPLTALAPGLQAYPATNAVDQQRETHWFSPESSSAPLLLIDLGEGKCIDFATLFFFIKDLPLTATLEASIDGGTWKEILPPTRITEQKKDVSFTPLYARYLRLNQTNTPRPYGQLSEIVVSTAEVPDLQMTQVAVVAGSSGVRVPRAGFTFNNDATNYQTDQYGKATLIAPKEEMNSLHVICPTTAGSVFQGVETPLQQTSLPALPRFSFFTDFLTFTGNVIFGDPALEFQKLSQIECSVSGALNEEMVVPTGYAYRPSCSCSDEVLELTGEYKAVPTGGNFMDLFVYLISPTASKAHRFRTANSGGDTPGNYISNGLITLSTQWNCWAGAPCPGGETGGNSNYGVNTWVPFKLTRNYDQVRWEVNGQSHSIELPEYGDDKMYFQFGGWTDRGENRIRNTKILCGEADPEAPPAQNSTTSAPEEEEEEEETPATNTTNSTTNGTITLPTFEQEIVPELTFEVVEVRETLSKLANREVQQQRACGEFQLVSPPEVYASDSRRPHTPQLAIDNDLTTGWFGDPDASFPKTFTADMNQEVCMNRLDLYVAKAETPLLIEVQVSNDGKVWDTLVKNYELTGDRYVGVPFPTTVVGRYVRIIQHASARPFGTVKELYLSAAPRIVAQPFIIEVKNEAGETLSHIPIAIRAGSEVVQELTTQEGNALIPDAFSLQGKTIEVTCPTGQ